MPPEDLPPLDDAPATPRGPAEFRGGDAIDRRFYVQSLPKVDAEPREAWITLVFVVAFLSFLAVVCVFVGFVISPTDTGTWYFVSSSLFAGILIGWAVLAGSRKAILGEGALFDGAVAFFFRRSEKPPPVDDAPAQLARRRGQREQALGLYEGWIAQHPRYFVLQLRRAEILLRDLRDPRRAERALTDLIDAIGPLDAKADGPDAQCRRLASAWLDEVRRGHVRSAGASDDAPPASPRRGPSFRG